MTYYVGNMPVGEHLAHYGTKGMKWGHRRYQNPDGSLTAAGQARYNRYTSGANRARTRAAMNRAAAGQSKSRLTRSIYGISDRYYSRRAARLTTKANRLKTGSTAGDDIRRAGGFKKATRDAWKAVRAERKANDNTANRKRNLRRAAAIAGGVALGAGAAYLGYRNRGAIKGLAKNIGSRVRDSAAGEGLAIRKHSKVGDAFKRASMNAGYYAGKAKNAANNAAGSAKRTYYKAKKSVKDHAKNRAKAGRYPGWVKDTVKSYPGAVKRTAYKAKDKVKAAAKKYNDYMNGPSKIFKYQTRRETARELGSNAAIIFGPTAAGYAAQKAYDKYGKNPVLKSNSWRKKHGYKADIYGNRYRQKKPRK